jgi:hypothetical protein
LNLERKTLAELEKAQEASTKAEEKLTAAQEKASNKKTSYLMQMRKIRQEMTELVDAGGRESDRYKELEAELGRVGTAYKTVQKEQQALTTAGTQISGIISGITGIMGAFSAAQGVMALSVNENEKLEAIQTKLQAAMAITTGLQSVQNTLHETSAFRMHTVRKATELWTAAQNRLTVAFGGSAIAAKALMATITLGLSVAIGGIIYLWDKYSSAQEKAAKRAQEIVEVEKNGREEMLKTRVELENTMRSIKEFNGTKE